MFLVIRCAIYALIVLVAMHNYASALYVFQVAAADFVDASDVVIPGGRLVGEFAVSDLDGDGVINQPQEFLAWAFQPTGLLGISAISNTDVGARPVRIGSGEPAPLAPGLAWYGAVFEVLDFVGSVDTIIGLSPTGQVSALNGEQGLQYFSPGAIRPVPVPASLVILGASLAGFACAGWRNRGKTKAAFDASIGIHPTAAEEFVTLREARPPAALAAE